MTFGAPEIIIVLAIIILFFGGKKIPEMIRGIGQGVKEFKNITDKSSKKENQESEHSSSSKS